MPTPNSTLYTGPITISSTSTLTAIAAGAGYLPSLAASAIFQQNAQPPAPVPSVAEGTYTSSQVFGFGLGFSSSLGGSTQNPQIILNGSSRLDDTRLQLTDGGYLEAGSAYYAVPVDIRSFVTDFSFQISNAGADGFTFVIQANGPNALGGPGSALGYGDDGATSGIPNSVAIKFDVFDNAGEGNDSTGLFLNGSRPLTPSLDLRSAGIDLSSGDTMQVHLSYDGAVLSMTITDGVTYTSYSTTFSVDIPGTVGSSTAYVGFTGATGGETASQKIMNWVFNKPDPSSSVPPVLKSTDF
jgi:hypothetical protein